MRVAAFASPDLDAVGRQVGFPLAVIATTTDPQAHVARMVRRQHACWSLCEDWIFGGVGGEELDPLQPNFGQLRFDPRWMGGRRLPGVVAIDSGSLIVVLPDAGLRAFFEAELRSILIPRRFDIFGARPGRVLRRRLSGRSITVAPRFSCHGRSSLGSTAFERVEDLYAFRPKDLPALAEAVAMAYARAASLQVLLASHARQR